MICTARRAEVRLVRRAEMLLRRRELSLGTPGHMQWSWLADFGHEWQDSPSLLGPLFASEQTTAIAFLRVSTLPHHFYFDHARISHGSDAVVKTHEITARCLEYINSRTFHSSSNPVLIIISTSITTISTSSLTQQSTHSSTSPTNPNNHQNAVLHWCPFRSRRLGGLCRRRLPRL